MIIFLILFFILLAGFFSGTETGLISLDRLQLEKQAKSSNKKKELLDFVNDPDKFLGTTLIGTNISIVIVTSLFSAYFIEQKGLISESFGTLYISAVILIIAEIIPKALNREHADRLIPSTFPVLRVFYRILFPFIFVISILNKLLTNLFGIEKNAGYQSMSKEDLSYLLSETKEDESLLEEQKEMLEEALEFNNLKAKNVMVPRIEMITIDQEMLIAEVLELAAQHRFTRYPVYDGSVDNIVGILIIYDLLKKADKLKTRAKDFVREAYYAPETIDISEMLKEMQKQRKSLAIIVDSFGGTAGMVTVEDIIEEIVGEIEDEYHHDENEKNDVIVINDNEYLVQGYVQIDELENSYDLILPAGNYETVAGLVLDNTHSIPQKGKIIKIENWEIKVMGVSTKKISLLKFSRRHK